MRYKIKFVWVLFVSFNLYNISSVMLLLAWPSHLAWARVTRYKDIKIYKQLSRLYIIHYKSNTL